MINVDFSNVKNASIAIDFETIDFIKKIDTYYFSIDKNLMNNIDNTYKVLSVVQALIRGWISCLSSITDKADVQIIYLPVGFYDEYLELIKLEILDGSVLVQYGYTEEIKGYQYSPSQINCLESSEVRSYDSLSDSFMCTKNDLIIKFNNIVYAINDLLFCIN